MTFETEDKTESKPKKYNLTRKAKIDTNGEKIFTKRKINPIKKRERRSRKWDKVE